MADVLFKSNLIQSWQHNHHRRRHGISDLPLPTGFLRSGTSYPPNNKALVLKLPSSSSYSSGSCFHGKRMVLKEGRGFFSIPRSQSQAAIVAQTGLRIGKAQKWWEKGLQSNMREVSGAQDLVDSLLNAGDKLVVVDFFSPGCGGCRALHPKICQLAEMNPDVEFLQVNYEEHKSMCYSLNVHVLPFFRFYRGAHGRLCSFSCTNATIKKFKDALAKHCPDRCSLGPTKGLEEKELQALAANKELSFNYAPKPLEQVPVPAFAEETTRSRTAHTPTDHLPLPCHSTAVRSAQDSEEKALVEAGR